MRGRTLGMCLFAWLALLVPVAGLHAQPKAAPFEELHGIVAEEMRATGTPGAAVAIVIGDKITFLHGYGVTSVETGVPVTEDTLFRVASTTKMLTAAALAVEADRGKLELHVPVRRYLPSLPPAIGAATAHQLLTHTAGLRDETHYFGPHDDGELERFVRGWRSDMQIAPPGDVYSYSNLGYVLAGRLLEQRTERRYADAMRESLFKPLGMTRTTLRPIEAMTFPFAQGHQPSTNGPIVVRPFADNVRYWPNGGVFTSAAEFARFAVAMLNGGRLDGQQAISERAVALMYGNYATVPGVPPYQYVYGLNLRTIDGRRVLQHGGERIGFGSLVRLIPERRIGVIVLGNRTGPSLVKTLEAATTIALDLPPVGPTPTALAPLPRPSGNNNPILAGDVPLGRYVNEASELSVELVSVGRGLVLRGNKGEAASVATLPDGRLVAGGQTFLLVRGARTGKPYLLISGRAFALVQAMGRAGGS